jgi:exonuclease SbcC
MRLTRLYLRNFRVYEDPLEIDVPPGLIGIYGPNGAGKTTLLESIRWALWGKGKTANDDIRTSGVGGDCVVEVEFEHEGHLYLTRRTLSGASASTRAEVHCDGLVIAEGVRDTSRYLHQVLGMDDISFRASVFAEQKQLAAFSDQSPAERRRLVLQLLGITPLDAARDAARKESREAREQYGRLRGMLPDLDQLRVEVDDARAVAAAAATRATDEEAVAAGARQHLVAAEEAFAAVDRLRETYQSLVVEGRAARAELDAGVASVKELQDEQSGLKHAALKLAEITPQADGLQLAEARLRLVETVVDAANRSAAISVPPEPPLPNEAAHERARQCLESSRAELAGLDGKREATRLELSRAREQADRSSALSGEADCPLCGQALGEAFEQVQAHRATDLADAEARLTRLERARSNAAAACEKAQKLLDEDGRRLVEAQRARQSWEQAVGRRRDADEVLAAAQAALLEADPRAAAPNASPDAMSALATELRQEADGRREAAALAERLRGRLDRSTAVAAQLERARQRVADAEHLVATLLDKVRSLGFDPAALESARTARQEAAAVAQRVEAAVHEALLAAERAKATADGETKRLRDAEAQHARLAELGTDVQHLGRLAELLSAFRNTVVASVGPRLAVQAADLFGELTDHEYDRLEVDADTYQLQISDGGRTFGLDRFSGSEVDLANLALRVAISEHVRFQSGGSVGLLVLDEVFGPLDEERKARMLLALERLRSRFRQILVVTHAADIKEQLPYAIEVQKRPGRRATARLLN